MDDIADGDLVLGGSPLAYLEEVKKNVKLRNFGDPDMGVLARYFIEGIESRGREGDDPGKEILCSLESLIFDCERSEDRRLLFYLELKDYYRNCFFSVMNLCLMGIGSSIRAEDISEFCYSQGRVYSIRDLEGDWNRGIINIPREILGLAEVDRDYPGKLLRRNPIVRSWIAKELVQSRKSLEIFQSRYEEFDRKTRFILRGLNESMLKYIET